MSSALASQTARVAWLLFPRGIAHKHLMFAAFLDDSGSHDDSATERGSEIVTVAGYVALESEWLSFEAAWNTFLADKGLPYYHTVDCVQRTGLFKDWTRAECDDAHREAVGIITSRNLLAVGYATLKSVFNDVHRQLIPDPAERVEKAAYHNSLLHVFSLLGRYVTESVKRERAPADARVAIVIEDAPKLYDATMENWRRSKDFANWQSILPYFDGAPAFRPKLGWPQLQAADVLAYEMTVNLRRTYLPNEPDKARRSWQALGMHALAQSRDAGVPPLVFFMGFGLGPIRHPGRGDGAASWGGITPS